MDNVHSFVNDEKARIFFEEEIRKTCPAIFANPTVFGTSTEDIYEIAIRLKF
jgi:hypothetical protein